MFLKTLRSKYNIIREVKFMSEFAFRQMNVDSFVTQAINGVIPKEKAIEAQKEFEKR